MVIGYITLIVQICQPLALFLRAYTPRGFGFTSALYEESFLVFEF